MKLIAVAIVAVCAYTMLNLVVAGLLTAVGLLLVMQQIGWRRVLYWQTPLDAALTLGVPFIFVGTFSGVVTAAFAGVFISLALSGMRWWYRIPPSHSVMEKAFRTKPMTKAKRTEVVHG